MSGRDIGGRLFRAAGRVRNRFGPSALILLYHRVAKDVIDPYNLCVSPEHFEEHLQVIRRLGRGLPLIDIAAGVRKGEIPRRAIAVTFDDGYQDNLYAARPLLEKHDVPATVFMTTGTIGRTREFWWDELERIFLRPGTLPQELQLTIHRDSHVWQLDEAAGYGAEDVDAWREWTLLDDITPTARHGVFRDIYRLLQPMTDDERTRTLDALLEWAGTPPRVRDSHRALEPDEVVDLSDGGLVEIGGHTENHPDLSSQPVYVQRDEIRRGRATLEQWLNRPVSSFAYPYGYFNSETVAEVRDAGFAQACMCGSEAVRRHSDPFLLPRVEVSDWHGEKFERVLRHHLRWWS